MRGFFIGNKNYSFCQYILSLFVYLLTVSLAFSPISSYAQSINLPVPGTMIAPSSAFAPVLLKGMTIHPDDPLKFGFIIDSGNTNFTSDEVKSESEQLVKYFLASMTVPKDDLWVNLSPYENDRIIPEKLSKTELGRDMLAQDYILKQLTASLMYPEKELGKKFWDKVYKKAEEQLGTSEIPVNTFNKVWILPETATVYEHEQTVYIVDAHLKVMLDSDYLAMQYEKSGSQGSVVSDQNSNLELQSSIIKEIIIPEIEHEVNEGQHFAPLRQIYHSLILAKWYKETIKNSLLSQVYVDRNLTDGVNVDDETIKDQIYSQYMEAYKKGVFNYIKEDYDRLSQEVIPRKYFSGGITGDVQFTKTSSPIEESGHPKYYANVELVPTRAELVPTSEGSRAVIKRIKEYLPRKWKSKLLSLYSWEKRLLYLHNSPEEAAGLIEQLISEKKASPKEIIEVLRGFYELLGTLDARDRSIKGIIYHIQKTPVLAQLLDELQKIDSGGNYWGYTFNPSLVRDILIEQAIVSTDRYNKLFDQLSPQLQHIAEIVTDPAGAFWKRTGLPLFHGIRAQLGRGVKTTRFFINTEWFHLSGSLHYQLKFHTQKTDGSYRTLEINPISRKIILKKGFEYEPNGLFDKKDITFYTKGDSEYGALIQEMSDIAKIVSETREEPLIKQQLETVVHWLENDQTLALAKEAEVPVWIREGYNEKPFGYRSNPEPHQKTEFVEISEERKKELADLKNLIWSKNPEKAARHLNKGVADGNLDYKDVLWLLNDAHLGDQKTWRWVAAVVLELEPKEFIWGLLEHFSEGFYGPKVRTPMLIDVMTQINSRKTARLLANTEFLFWALRLEEKFFGMSLESSRALIKSLYDERAMTPEELAILLIDLIRMKQKEVQTDHTLYQIRDIAIDQLSVLKDILKEMDSEDFEKIIAVFREEFGQDIHIKGFIESNKDSSEQEPSSGASSPILEEDVGGIDLNAIDVDRQGSGVDIQFDPVEVQEFIDMGITGFAPVIINLTPLPSALPLLGLIPQRDEEPITK